MAVTAKSISEEIAKTSSGSAYLKSGLFQVLCPPRLIKVFPVNLKILLHCFELVWPIGKSELPRFLMLTLLMFCILGIQNLVRALKDSVVITLLGAETISFVKLFGVMPAAVLISIIYMKLLSCMRASNVFYLIVGTFLIFFALFAFVLYPNAACLHLSYERSQLLIGEFPRFRWFILLLGNWSFALYYVITELWSSSVYALLFWQFVNSITNVDQSKRFYPLFGFFGQTGLIISGFFLQHISIIDDYFIDLFNLSGGKNLVTVQVVISVVLVLGVIALCTFWCINTKILDSVTIGALKFRVKKKQLGVVDSFKMVARSKYIGLIAFLLFTYGFVINLAEVPWKGIVQSRYKNVTDYASFVGSYLSYTGFLTVSCTLIGSFVVRKFGWLTSAMVTPVAIFSTGFLFFSMLNFDSVQVFMMFLFAVQDPMMVAVVVGSIQNIASKSTKYAFFDPAREMAYVPLPDELKTNGKAVADTLGVKMGKAFGSFIQSTILILLAPAVLVDIVQYVMWIFIFACGGFIWVVWELNKEYSIACNKNPSN